MMFDLLASNHEMLRKRKKQTFHSEGGDMIQFTRFIGVAVLGVCLLGLNTGCGKKMVRGSTGMDQRTTHASLKGMSTEQQRERMGGLSSLERENVNGEFDLKQGYSGLGGKTNLLGAGVRGKNGQMGDKGLSHFPKGTTNQAMLTTPASTASSRFDSPYVTSAFPSAESLDSRRSGMSQSNTSLPDQLGGGSSLHQAQRKGVTFSNGLHDIYFQFDSWRLTDESRSILEANAEWLKANAHERIKIEGHCDERGTQAYNFVLGEKRASMVQQYLSFLGVPHHQLIVTSFGKDKPGCQTFSEACFQKNRRAHFASDLNVAVQ
jgi:peptidoglycan-associated lipoprotein